MRPMCRVEELMTEGKVDANAEGEVMLLEGGPEDPMGEEPRSVDNGLGTRRTPGAGGGKPQGDCCALPAREPEF